MNIKLNIGDFGRFVFTILKKRPGGFYETPFDIEGAMVTEMDAKNVYLRGTDGVPYLVTRSRLKSFEPMKQMI